VSRSRFILGLLVVAILAAASVGEAQRRGGRGFGRMRLATAADFDGSFHFCRVAFQGRRGSSWSVDSPQADVNLSIRLSELTRVRVSFDADREPNHLVVRLTDPELFQCPFVMMTEVGTLYLDDDETARLREYLLKGGFVWADDFWGSYEWQNWEREIRCRRSRRSTTGWAAAVTPRSVATTVPWPRSAASSTSAAARWS
jgi:hypothetical protein